MKTLQDVKLLAALLLLAFLPMKLCDIWFLIAFLFLNTLINFTFIKQASIYSEGWDHTAVAFLRRAPKNTSE